MPSHFVPLSAMNRSYINVDELQAQTTLEEAAAKCGVQLELHGQGAEVRIDCPFGCAGDHIGRQEIAINRDNAQRVFCCHAYGCGFRGNLLGLMHGWLTGARPAGNKLKGEEFNCVKRVLASDVPTEGTEHPLPRQSRVIEPSSVEPVQNLPLAASENEKLRELVTLADKFIVEPARMNSVAASYVRRHPCLTVDAMRKFGVGYLPQDGGGDKRGWSLRGQIIYTQRSEQGEVLCFFAREPAFEDMERRFLALPADERAATKPPHKHRFPAGYFRGLELYGQHASRLDEPGYREQIARLGIIVAEGPNSVINLDNIGVPAVALCSNRITAEQVSKITRWAKHLAGGKVSLLFDVDEPGDEGAKDALWQLMERGLDVRLAWSRGMHAGAFVGRQPESLTVDEWQSAILPTIER